MSLLQAARRELRMFFIALQFLTRVPVPAWVGVGFQPHWLNRCVVHFPLVGALVGVVGAVVLWLVVDRTSPLVAALLAVTVTVWLTGAFHEDGLADTFDALGGHVPRERALEIMKDSRVGTYGAAALGLSLALRVGLLAELIDLAQPAAPDLEAAAWALVVAHLLGRTGAVVLMAWLPYAGDVGQAKAKPLAVAVPWRTAGSALWWAALLLSIPVGVAAWVDAEWASVLLLYSLLAASTGGLVVLAMRRWLWARLGGYTGDTLGATEQLIEVAVLLVLCVV